MWRGIGSLWTADNEDDILMKLFAFKVYGGYMEDKVYVYHGLYILALVRGNWRKEFMLNQIFWPTEPFQNYYSFTLLFLLHSNLKLKWNAVYIQNAAFL